MAAQRQQWRSSETNALQLLLHVCVTSCVLNPGTGSWMEIISSLSWRSASSSRWPWWNTWVRRCSRFYSQHQEHLSVHDSLMQLGRVRLHSCCYNSLIYQIMYKTSTVNGKTHSLSSLKVFRCISYRQASVGQIVPVPVGEPVIFTAGVDLTC